MPNAELNLLGLILGASLPVKLVMALLLGASIASWMIIFRKKAMIDRATRSAEAFEERFWAGTDLAGLFKELSARGQQISGLESVFEAGFREFAKLRSRRSMDPALMVEARSVPCGSPSRARWTASRTSSSSSPRWARPAPTSACSARCGES